MGSSLCIKGTLDPGPCSSAMLTACASWVCFICLQDITGSGNLTEGLVLVNNRAAQKSRATLYHSDPPLQRNDLQALLTGRHGAGCG